VEEHGRTSLGSISLLRKVQQKQPRSSRKRRVYGIHAPRSIRCRGGRHIDSRGRCQPIRIRCARGSGDRPLAGTARIAEDWLVERPSRYAPHDGTSWMKRGRAESEKGRASLCVGFQRSEMTGSVLSRGVRCFYNSPRPRSRGGPRRVGDIGGAVPFSELVKQDS